jgi:hypothetical protein
MNIDPKSDESAIVRVQVQAMSGPFSESFARDMLRVCEMAKQYVGGCQARIPFPNREEEQP